MSSSPSETASAAETVTPLSPHSCFVCGVVAESQPDVTSVHTRLTCSGSSAGEFLLGFNIVPCHDRFGPNLREDVLCKACFEVVVNCDQWNYMLLSSMEGLREKAAKHSGRIGGEGGLLLPKIEMDVTVSYI